MPSCSEWRYTSLCRFRTAGTDPAVAQMDFDNDGLGIATERGDVIGAWACFHIPDIFVEVDWMPGHEMSNEAVAKVLWAFARQGIVLHIDRGEMGGGNQIIQPTTFWFRPRAGNSNDFYDFKWGNGWDMNGNNMVDFGVDNLRGNFSVNRLGIFHYCIMGQEYAEVAGSSGKSGGIPDDDFFVSDGKLKDMWWLDYTKILSSTFMHELGHNLGLHHYGNVDQCPHAPDHDEGAGCPDYVSIMSYHYQLSPGDWPSGWGGNPNYGSRTGWSDWANLNIASIQNAPGVEGDP